MGIFDTMLVGRERRSLENPSTSLATPDDWLFDAFGATKSNSGVRVSAESALCYSAWWRGIWLVSNSVAKLPLYVYKRSGEDKAVDDQHAAYRLLRHRSNDELVSANTLKETIQSHAMSYGNGYAWIRRDGSARPLELIILNPFDVVPYRENGRLWYAIKVGMEWKRESPANVLHIKGLSPDGLVGYSVYVKARDSLGEGMAAQQYGSRFFRNSARPSVVIEVPTTMTEPAQREFLRQWENMFGSVEQSHRTAILTSGAKVHPFSVNPEQSQLYELRKLNLVDIANFIGVPVHKIGGEGRTAYASLEQENQSYLDDCLDPWLVKWECECREKLLTEQEKERDTHFVEFLRQAMVRADIAARYAAYQIGVRGGWLNPDGVCAKENENALPNGLGKNYFRAKELAVAGEDPTPAVSDVNSMTAITSQVTDKKIPPETAKTMLRVSFPLLTEDDIDGLIDPLAVWETPKPEPAVVPGDPVVITDDLADPPSTDAVRRVMADAVRRAARNLRIQAVRRSKLSGNFLEMIDADRESDEQRTVEIIEAPAAICRQYCGATATDAEIGAQMVAAVKGCLLAAADDAHTREELTEAVERRLTELETTLPESVATSLTKGVANGTSLSA